MNYPGETWYEMTVGYSLEVKAGNTTYTTGGPVDATFVVRQADVEGEPHPIWRIIIWRDDVGGSVAARAIAFGEAKTDGANSGAGSAVEESTWGQVKSLYSG